MYNYEKALIIFKGTLGEDHPDIALVYRNMGDVFRIQGKNEKVLKNYKKALVIREKKGRRKDENRDWIE